MNKFVMLLISTLSFCMQTISSDNFKHPNVSNPDVPSDCTPLTPRSHERCLQYLLAKMHESSFSIHRKSVTTGMVEIRTTKTITATSLEIRKYVLKLKLQQRASRQSHNHQPEQIKSEIKKIVTTEHTAKLTWKNSNGVEKHYTTKISNEILDQILSPSASTQTENHVEKS